MFTTNSQIVQQKYGAYPSAHASLQLWRLRRVASLPSGGDLRSLRGGKHRAEATAHAPSGRPHPHAATSKVTHRAVDRSVQRGYLEHSAVNSPGRVLVTPGATTVLSQLNSRNRLCDPPRAAASVARRVGGPAREPVVRRPPSSAARSRLDGAEARSALSLEDSTSRVRRAGAVRLLIARKKVPPAGSRHTRLLASKNFPR